LHTDEPLDRPPSEEIRLEEVATLRNDFRQLIGEHTARVGNDCKVCSADSAAAARKDFAHIEARMNAAVTPSEKAAARGKARVQARKRRLFPLLNREPILFGR
jgi:hypothetical protein